MPRKDPERHRLNQIIWRSNNKLKVIAATYKWRNKNMEKYTTYNTEYDKTNKDWYINYKKEQKCLQCGITDFRVLDFHHREPKEKSFNVSAKATGKVSIKTLMTEIAKCDILCSNCHRIVTWESRQKVKNAGSEHKSNATQSS